MGGMMTGMAAHGGVLPIGGTFFVFSDYMRGAVRLAALSGVQVVYSWTHDSVGLGEDGPTHQPIEQLAAVRAMPGLRVIRPADANESAQALAPGRRDGRADGPVLTRQKVPVLEGTAARAADGVARGAYVLRDEDPATPLDLVLIGTGSEVRVCLDAADLLAAGGRQRPGGVLAQLGTVRGPGRRLPLVGAAGRGPPPVGRGRQQLRVGAVGRRLGGHRPLRGVGTG